MGNIIILDELTANQIAAGEVVERPSSVVKELIENSIDAKATNINIEIKNGGIAFIKVTDNGCGMEADDIQMAFERHATSKIRGPKDLEAISSFGFRGEALASIASVSKVKLLTKTKDFENGVLLELTAGKVIDSSPFAAKVGTSITVSELFFNTPARFKFLKKDSTEAGNISDAVSRIALGNPSISFKFINNKNLSLHTPGNNDLKSTIFSIYGKEIAKNILPVLYENKGVTVSGFVGNTDISRATRNHQTFFINKRYIKSKIVTAAIDQAYKTLLMKNKYPFAVLNLEINPALIDINVHPAKLEVRFSEEQEVFRVIYNGINNALSKSDPTRNAEKQTSSREFFALNRIKENISNAVSIGISKDDVVTSGKNNLAENFVPNCYTKETTKVNKKVPQLGSFLTKKQMSTKTDAIEKEAIEKEAFKNCENEDIKEPIHGLQKDILINENEGNKQGSHYALEIDKKTNEGFNFAQKTISEKTDWKIFRTNYTYIGQLFKTYIVVEQEKETILIDQHAAHERVMFEKLKKKYYEKEPLEQVLLEPLNVEITMKESLFLKENLEVFKKTGFLIDEFGENSFLIRTVPFALRENTDPKRVFLETLDFLMCNYKEKNENEIIEQTLYNMACKSAIKANKTLCELEVKTLINDLEKLENPYTCPHGRPTVLKLTKQELEKLFKRIV